MAAASEQERTQQQWIALFRSLFRGRDDVYARRWQSADGRSGYMPASLKDWNAINRSRPEDRRKVDQATRTLLPLTDAVIERRLSGRDDLTQCDRSRLQLAASQEALPLGLLRRVVGKLVTEREGRRLR